MKNKNNRPGGLARWNAAGLAAKACPSRTAEAARGWLGVLFLQSGGRRAKSMQ